MGGRPLDINKPIESQIEDVMAASQRGEEVNMGYTPIPTGPPVVLASIHHQVCPNCKGETLYSIRAPVKADILTSGEGYSTYLGCAACPYASPAICVDKTAGETRPPQKRS